MRIWIVALALIALAPAERAGGQSISIELPAACVEAQRADCAVAVIQMAEREALSIGNPNVPGEAAFVSEMIQAIRKAAETERQNETPDDRKERIATAELAARVEFGVATAKFVMLVLTAWAYVQAEEPDAGNRLVPAMMAEWNLLEESVAWGPDGYLGDFAGYIAEAQAYHGFFQDALSTVDQIDDPEERDRALADIVGAQAEQGLVQDALGVAERITYVYARDEAFSYAAKAQASAGDLAGARTTAARISEGYWANKAWTAIAEVQVAGDDLDGALAAVANIDAAAAWHAVPDRAEILGKIALVQAVEGEPDKARATFATAVDIAEASDMLRSWLFSDLIEKQVSAGLFAEAIATAKRTGSLAKQAGAYLAVAAAHAEAGRDEEARADMREAVAAAAMIGPPAPNTFDVRSNVLGEIAETQLALGQIADAWNTAAMIEANSTQVEILLAIAEASVAAGTTGEAGRAYDAAHEAATGNADLLIKIAGSQAKAGFFDDALATAARVTEPAHKASALHIIAVEQVAAGQGVRARQSLSIAAHSAAEIDALAYRSEELLEIAQSQAAAGFAEDAFETVATALLTAELIEDPGDRIEALASIAQMWARIGNLEAARRSFAAAREANAEIELGREDPYTVWESIACIADEIDEMYGIEAAEAEAGLLEDALRSIGREPYASCRAAGFLSIVSALQRHTAAIASSKGSRAQRQ